MRLVEGSFSEVLAHVQSTACVQEIVRARLHDPSLLDEQIDSLQTTFYHPDGRIKIVDTDVPSWKVLMRISECKEDGSWKIPLLAYERVPARLEIHRDALEGIIGRHITDKKEIADHLFLRVLIPDKELRDEFSRYAASIPVIEPFGVYLSKEHPYAFFRKISLGGSDKSSSIYCYNGCYRMTVLER